MSVLVSPKDNLKIDTSLSNMEPLFAVKRSNKVVVAKFNKIRAISPIPINEITTPKCLATQVHERKKSLDLQSPKITQELLLPETAKERTVQTAALKKSFKLNFPALETLSSLMAPKCLTGVNPKKSAKIFTFKDVFNPPNTVRESSRKHIEFKACELPRINVNSNHNSPRKSTSQ